MRSKQDPFFFHSKKRCPSEAEAPRVPAGGEAVGPARTQIFTSSKDSNGRTRLQRDGHVKSLRRANFFWSGGICQPSFAHPRRAVPSRLAAGELQYIKCYINAVLHVRLHIRLHIALRALANPRISTSLSLFLNVVTLDHRAVGVGGALGLSGARPLA